jgi:hypothetical protein
MKITRVITGLVAVTALISISLSSACSIFSEKKTIYTGNRPEGFYEVTVTEKEGWYNWFCAEKNTVTFQARVVDKNEVDLYYEGKRHSWLEKAGKEEIRWHHKVGVGSFFGVPWRYEKRIDILPRDHPFFEMFQATAKHWQAKQRPLWLPSFRTVGIFAAVVLVAVLAAVGVSVYSSKRRKRKAADAAAAPTAPAAARPPSYERPPPPPPGDDIPPAAPPARKKKLKPLGCVALVIVAALVLVLAAVAAYFVADHYGVNPLTKPPSEEVPAPPPAEVQPEPAAPKAKITFAILQVAGGGRDAASVRDALAGKAESISVICEGRGSGELDVELTVSAKGNGVRAKVIRSTYKNAALESKIAHATRGWKFGAARGTSIVKIRIKVD